MSVHKKLMEARIRLQKSDLKKSGHNKFAGYNYFELGDFIPTVQQIFSDIGLCGFVSFGVDLATLTITDGDSGYIIITSPMADAQTKGSLPIQALGSAQTYLRRYLWMAALEIVEHDEIDALGGKSAPKSVAKDVWDTLDEAKQRDLQGVVDHCRHHMENGDINLAVELLGTIKDADDKVALWSRFDSKERASIKKYQESLKPLGERE